MTGLAAAASVFLIFSISSKAHGLWSETVSTPYGSVKGFTQVLPSGKQVQLFRGIPFAKPPVGSLRFEKPKAPVPWSGVLNATAFGPTCVQFLGLPYTPSLGSEDCLTINIARPVNASSDPKGYPVALYLFGGAYVSGSGSSAESVYTYDNVVTKGVIFASINYRLGPLGYYSSRDGRAPGNYASWDQLRALKFIQKVIKNFGGNKNKVTLFGVSAGGVSTSFLTYSHASAGLFHRTMPMCGNAHALSSQSINNDISSAQLEVLAGCNNTNNKKHCLKGLSLADLVNYAAPVSYITSDTIDFTLWGPRFDNDLIIGNGLTEALATATPVDTLVSVNSNEGISFAVNTGILSPTAVYYPVQAANAPNFNETAFIAGFDFLLSQRNAYVPNAAAAIQDAVAFYQSVKNNFGHDQYLQSYTQFFSDVQFNVAVTRELLLKATTPKKVYFYEHDYVAPQYFNPLFDGAAHCMDSNYIFDFINDTSDPTTAQVKNTVIDFFVSFVKTGVPSSGALTVPAISTSNVSYVHVGATQSVKINPFEAVANFWNNLAGTYGFDWTTGKPTGEGM